MIDCCAFCAIKIKKDVPQWKRDYTCVHGVPGEAGGAMDPRQWDTKKTLSLSPHGTCYGSFDENMLNQRAHGTLHP